MILWVFTLFGGDRRATYRVDDRLARQTMNNFGVISRKWLLVIAGMLVYTGSAWATSNTCPNTTSSSSVNNLATNNTVTIPGTGGGTPANDLNSLGATGCTAVDWNFVNFNNSTFTGDGGNGAGTLAGTYLAETPAGTYQVEPSSLPVWWLISS